jgi:TatD DNase family protein
MSLNLIDSHCHLDMEAFDSDRDASVERALSAGVTRMITIGTGSGIKGAHNAIQLAERHESVWATVGVHPHCAGSEYDIDELRRLAKHPKVVGIGETGLDFYRDWAPVDRQYETFKAQIALAKEVKKPLVIHSRNAGEECIKVLVDKDAADVGGVFHCFAETAAFAARLSEIGFYVSFPGQVTFKKANDVREVCRHVPLERILVETDAPFLAPEPHRGKRCEPSFVVDTARKLAEIKGVSLEEIAAVTTQNALRLFSHMR